MSNRYRMLLLLVATFALPVTGWAQGFGPPDSSMIFRFMDRNGDGRLDKDEIDNSRGPMRDRLREARIDYSRGLSQDDFVKTMDRLRSSSDGDRGGFDRSRSDDERRREEERRRDEERRREEDRRGDDNRNRDGDSRESRSSSSSSTAPPPRKPITLDLQQTFRAGDTDLDGQIGFYEWRKWKGRAQSAEFARLDMNGDGFVTPREIERAATMPAAATTVVVTTGTATPAAAAPTAAPEAASAPAMRAGPDPSLAGIAINEEDAAVRRYRSTFKLLDRDGSGAITTDEWERSTNYRGRFNTAKIDITQPMDGDTFVRHLLKMDSESAPSAASPATTGTGG